MGAWAMGPFDSDHAADFASSVHACSGPEARLDLLAITFGAFMDIADGSPEIALDNESESPMIIEEVIASAAFIADGSSGRQDFTDTPYAKNYASSDLDEVGAYADLGLVPMTLVLAAFVVINRVVRLMRKAGVGPEWIEEPEKISDVLQQEVARR